jgi:adenine-specific DNA-methyltransferase
LFLQNKPKAKKHETKHTIAVRFTKDFDLANQSINDFINENGYHLTSLNQNSWVVGERDIYNIKEFVEKQGIELKNWNISINYGIKTGLTEAFIIDEKTKNEIITNDPKSADIIKPVLKGRDISTWYPKLEKQYLIFSHNGSKSQNIKPVNVEKDYKGVFEWFKNFEDKLKARQDQGDEWYNLRSCAYLNEFSKPKVIYREITQKFDFSFDSGEILFIDTAWMMVGEHIKYLTVMFNSNLFNYCFRDNFTDLGSGGRRLKKVFFEKVPIKKITDTEEKPFALILDYLVALKKENSQEPSDQFMFIYFEQIANALVYELYFKEEFDKAGLAVAKYVAELPALDAKEKPLHQLRKIYITVNQQQHPVRQAIFSMLSIPQLELINNTSI